MLFQIGSEKGGSQGNGAEVNRLKEQYCGITPYPGMLYRMVRYNH